MSVEPGYAIPPIGRRLRDAARKEGALRAGGRLAGWGARYVAGAALASRGTRRRFTFAGREYPYLVHRYNFTWMHERAVEVPIARAELAAAPPGARILEVGHVLGHYAPTDHEVVDKYEPDPGVRNVDVLDLDPSARYDLVLSVSTLEHVGIDDTPADPARAVSAVDRLRGMVAPGGRLFVTIPLGYNPPLVDAVRSGRAGFGEVRAMARTGPGLDWSEVAPEQVWDAAYDRLLYRARAILLCSFSP